jgi:hypothetical protein
MKTLSDIPSFAEAEAHALTWKALTTARTLMQDIDVMNLTGNLALAKAVASTRHALASHLLTINAIWDNCDPREVVKGRHGLHLVG